MRVKKSVFLLFILLGLSMLTSCGGSSHSSSGSGTSAGGSSNLTISGTVTLNSAGLLGVTMTLTGSATAQTTTDSNGNYSFLVASGNYTITPSLAGYTFSPANSANAVNGTNAAGVAFTASGSTAIVKTIAGSITGAPGLPNANPVVGTAAFFSFPAAITTDGTNLYVADTFNNAIRQIVIATGQVTTLAGSLSGTSGPPNTAVGQMATFFRPYGITTDGTNLYVADTYNNVVRQIVIATGQVTTLAGTGIQGPTNTAPVNGNAATFNLPYGITTDGTNIWLSDNVNCAIRQIAITIPQTVTTVAGSLTGKAGFANGTGNAATFYLPQGITTDGINLYVADTFNNAIRKIVIATGVVTTIAGTGTPGFANGIGTAATFNGPKGIILDRVGINIYVADTLNNAIRKIVIATGAVTTLVGSTAGTPGFTDGIGTQTAFNGPQGITISPQGTDLYVTDYFNNAIRMIQLP